jgi:hypothetical protein
MVSLRSGSALHIHDDLIRRNDCCQLDLAAWRDSLCLSSRAEVECGFDQEGKWITRERSTIKSSTFLVGSSPIQNRLTFAAEYLLRLKDDEVII